MKRKNKLWMRFKKESGFIVKNGKGALIEWLYGLLLLHYKNSKGALIALQENKFIDEI